MFNSIADNQQTYSHERPAPSSTYIPVTVNQTLMIDDTFERMLHTTSLNQDRRRGLNAVYTGTNHSDEFISTNRTLEPSAQGEPDTHRDLIRGSTGQEDTESLVPIVGSAGKGRCRRIEESRGFRTASE